MRLVSLLHADEDCGEVLLFRGDAPLRAAKRALNQRRRLRAVRERTGGLHPDPRCGRAESRARNAPHPLPGPGGSVSSLFSDPKIREGPRKNLGTSPRGLDEINWSIEGSEISTFFPARSPPPPPRRVLGDTSGIKLPRSSLLEATRERSLHRARASERSTPANHQYSKHDGVHDRLRRRRRRGARARPRAVARPLADAGSPRARRPLRRARVPRAPRGEEVRPQGPRRAARRGCPRRCPHHPSPGHPAPSRGLRPSSCVPRPLPDFEPTATRSRPDPTRRRASPSPSTPPRR